MNRDEQNSTREEKQNILKKDSYKRDLFKEYLGEEELEEFKIKKNYTGANFFSQLFFAWARPIMTLATKRCLENFDVCNLSEDQSINKNIEDLEKLFEKISKKYKFQYPLFITLFIFNYKLILFILFLSGCQMVFIYIRIYLINQILSLFSSNYFFPERNFSIFKLSDFNFNIIECIVLFLVSKLFSSAIFNHLELNDAIINRKIANEISALITSKILRSNISCNSAKAEGEKINLVEVDAERIGFFYYIFPRVLTSPIKIGISMFFLFRIFGGKFFYALLGLFFILLILFIFQYFYVKNLENLLEYKDKRMKIVTFVFQVLKSLKLNSWDEEFIHRINDKRNQELYYAKKSYNINIVIHFLNANLNLILLILSLSIFIMEKKSMEISSLFTAFQLINTMTGPIKSIPSLITQLFCNLISIKRLQDFMKSEEILQKPKENIGEDNILLQFNNTTFGITKKNNNENNFNNKIENNKINENKEKIILLKNITLTIKKGELIAILGCTGSGKSCLINAILNNYHIFNTDKPIINRGEISYCSQIPWIMTDTIKKNIIFFRKFRLQKYRKIISLCQLEKDFSNLAEGEETIINSTCTNISGGQKARISIARCLYKDADLYLFDDPFASIDNRVSQKIFEDIICGYLKEKTRILILNEYNYLNKFDKIFYMNNGEIIFNGNYNEFQKFIENKKNIFSEKNIDEENNDNEKISENIFVSKQLITNNEEKEEESHSENNNYQNANDFLNKTSTNNVSYKTYLDYIHYQGGFIIFLILIFLITLTKIIESYRKTILPNLSKNYKEISDKKTTKKQDLEFLNTFQSNFIFYSRLTIICILLNSLIEYVVTRAQIFSMRKIHEKMIRRLVKAPINLFHDVVPVGQILNHLTKDLGVVQGIIGTVNSFIKIMFSLFSIIGVCFIYNKIIILFAPLVMIVGWLLTFYYLKAGRNLTRLFRISYSPIMTILSETIRGVDTIRTSHVEEETKKKMYKKIDDRYGIFLYEQGCKRWLSIRRGFFTQCLFGIIILSMAYFSKYYSVKAMAIVLTCTEEFLVYLIDTTTYYCDLEVSMIGLERCQKILQTPIEKNKSLIIDKKNDNWPKKGKIEFINYSVSYRPDLPNVLNDINILINPGEKVGIVGRTGSGKSSFLLSLSRIMEPKKGKILIDDKDIENVDLEFLREKLSVVPQEPFIIESSLRDNIDPLKKYSDEEILNVLNNFGLFQGIKNVLKMEIKENGKNLSTGEKQLICFARTVIKKNKIIILDEATSYLDEETEKIIKENMKKYFKDYTVIMVSHHIQMVKECDKIIVIDDGKIVEIGNHASLIRNKNSFYYGLYQKENQQI